MLDDLKFIELTFTREEWRLICVACASVKKSSLIDPDGVKKTRLSKIAHRIAEATGKDA